MGRARSIRYKFHSRERLIDYKRNGTGDKNNKDEKSVNGTQLSIGKFPPGKQTTFTEIPFIPENFQWNEPKSRVPFTSQPEFPEFFGKGKTISVSNVLERIEGI